MTAEEYTEQAEEYLIDGEMEAAKAYALVAIAKALNREPTAVIQNRSINIDNVSCSSPEELMDRLDKFQKQQTMGIYETRQ